MTENTTINLNFNNNKILSELVGASDSNLSYIENRFGVSIAVRGNHISISGAERDVDYAKNTLHYVYAQINKGKIADNDLLENAIKIVKHSVTLTPHKTDISNTRIQTKKKMIFPRSENQALYLDQIQNKDLVFGVGSAGTGKTYLAVAVGISMLISGKVEKMILTRPAVEAGEKIGFLPGDMKEKVDPYLRPLYDAMYDMLPSEQVEKRINNGEIEIAPLAFMRGRTLSNAFIILDEAQNTSIMQMKMFLTRLGHNSKMVVTGDLTQIDLPKETDSGLNNAIDVLKNIQEIGFIQFNEADIARHPIVSKIVNAYSKIESEKKR